MTYHPYGTVVLAVIPFSDQIQTKLRPAVVVSASKLFDCYGDLTLLGITSQVKPVPPFRNLEIARWKQAGLPKPSMFKPGLFTLESTKIKHVFGILAEEDEMRLRKLLMEMLMIT